jgi:thiosulfate dehydrogenase [quinone] large subunit
VSAAVLLPLRLFLGVTFMYAGTQKLTDPQYFRLGAPGYVGRQIAAFAVGSPLHGFLTSVALPHAALFGLLVAWGELGIGLGTLVGWWLRPASFFGLLISAIFFLSATWRVHPYFYGSDIVFAFGWLTLMLAGAEGTGGLALDVWLAPPLIERFVLRERRAGMSRCLALVLGLAPTRLAPFAKVDDHTGATVVPGAPRSARPAIATGTRGHTRRVRRSGRHTQSSARHRASRREFLWGLASGVAGTVLVGLFGRLMDGDGASPETTMTPISGTAPTATASSASPATTAAGSTPASAATPIAQVGIVPNNSAVSFTIPTSGDPGVLVRLGNGKFVAFDATCTHAGCPVQYDSGSGLLICPCHGAAFDPTHGAAVVQGPAGDPLSSVPIQVDTQSGNITLSQ